MNRGFNFLWLILLIGILGIPELTHATHIRAGEIIAERVSASSRTYKFKFIGFRDTTPGEVIFGEGLIDFGDDSDLLSLNQLDPEFSRLFKVAADFDERFDRSDDHARLYARMVATIARKEKLKPIDRAGMAHVLEFAARKVSDTEKLSTDIEGLLDLLCEADHWATRNGRATISAA